MGLTKKSLLSRGGEYHVADVSIWAQIYYLDSSTNYREYLPQNSRLQGRRCEKPMALLDSVHYRSVWTSFARFVFGKMAKWKSWLAETRDLPTVWL
jgi:hypothetical protein